MSSQSTKTPLFTFTFLGLCALIFLAYCNICVFYSLYVHLCALGIDPAWRGLLVGGSSLATIVCYLLFSHRLTSANAPRTAFLGAATLIVCGASYLVAQDAASILAVRLGNGLGVYLLTASAMTMLVECIPTERSGQAFGLYSVAILLPYSVVPMVFETLSRNLHSIAQGYMVMSLALVPAMPVVMIIARKRARSAPAQPPAEAMRFKDMARKAARPRPALLFALTTMYLTGYSSMFFLAKGMFQSRGLGGVGTYFAVQTACMIALRLLGNRLFDRVRKVILIRLSFALLAAGFLLAAFAHTPLGLWSSGVVLGAGMGLGSPALYSLLFALSDPAYRAVNTNLMSMSQQMGSFLGPLLGAAAVELAGYDGFLGLDILTSLLALGMSFALTWRRVDPDGLAARS